ncbi:condensation domain-containing protein, partial [Nocardia asiatica]
METRVARVWQQVLGGALPDRDTSFFAAGGDSLSATRLVGRLGRELGLTVTLREFFTTPTIAGLVGDRAHLEVDTSPSPLLTTDVVHRHEPFPLTDIQVAYWLGRSADFDLGGIGAQLYFEYDWPRLDVDRLEQAWNRLIAQHAMLRAVIEDGSQRILAEVPRYRIPVLDADDDFDGAAARVREAMSGAVPDPSAWPLFEIRVIRGSGIARICTVFDSLIVDGLSALVLISEWLRLYAEPDTELAPTSIEFRDYVTGRAPSEEQIQEALSYWRARLPELPPGPQLPLRVSPAAVERPRFVRREFRLDLKTWGRITERARGFGVTPSVVLLAAYTWVLGRW